MAKDRRTHDQKRKKKLEERKRKAREAESLAYMGEKYKTDELVPTWMHTEVGIYEAYVITDRRVFDQTVVAALESLIRQIRAGTLPPLEDTSAIQYEVGREEDLVIESIRRSWACASRTNGSPPGTSWLASLGRFSVPLRKCGHPALDLRAICVISRDS